MKKVTAYQCPKGILEQTPERAFAWHLNHISNSRNIEKVPFTSALWIFENINVVKELISEFEIEMLTYEGIKEEESDVCGC